MGNTCTRAVPFAGRRVGPLVRRAAARSTHYAAFFTLPACGFSSEKTTMAAAVAAKTPMPVRACQSCNSWGGMGDRGRVSLFVCRRSSPESKTPDPLFYPGYSLSQSVSSVPMSKIDSSSRFTVAEGGSQDGGGLRVVWDHVSAWPSRNSTLAVLPW